jgi:hypothetical protein
VSSISPGAGSPLRSSILTIDGGGPVFINNTTIPRLAPDELIVPVGSTTVFDYSGAGFLLGLYVAGISSTYANMTLDLTTDGKVETFTASVNTSYSRMFLGDEVSTGHAHIIPGVKFSKECKLVVTCVDAGAKIRFGVYR